MAHEPSAAEALYGHLKSAERPTQRPSSKSVAEAMWPSLVKKPPPPSDPYLRHMQAMGLIRKEGKR
jgi:hypothetical protein